MTYKLAFNESALKEWKKLGHTIQEQFKKKLRERVDVTTFHTDPEQQLNDVMAVKQKIFAHPPYPNWTAVGVTWLAGFDFEIKVIARIP
ncbi:Rid family hydrolase [Salmonella enterica subsp. enterica serovar Montevideo]